MFRFLWVAGLSSLSASSSRRSVWAGIALVLCGVALVARPVARLEEKL